jgi:hypothetical protein
LLRQRAAFVELKMVVNDKFKLKYANEKLYGAVRNMVASPKGLHDRLDGAYLAFHTLHATHNLEALPPELRSKLEDIFERLTREEAKGSEGKVRATLNVMSEDDAQNLAHDTFDLYHAVHGLHEANKARK